MLRNRGGRQAIFSIKTSSNQYVNGTIQEVFNMTDMHNIVQSVVSDLKVEFN